MSVKPCSSWRIACIRMYLLPIHSSTEFSSLLFAYSVLLLIVKPNSARSRHLPQNFFQVFCRRGSANASSGACSSPQRASTVQPHRTRPANAQVFTT